MTRLTAACLLASCALLRAAGDEKPAVRAYTNDDLARYERLRTEEPAEVPAAEERPARGPRSAREPQHAQDRSPARGEAYWRREAERTAEQVRRLREQSDAVAEKLRDLRREPGILPYSDPRLVRLEALRRALDERVREAELRLEERARRAGALPGWLR
jgi:hypothetical protein